MGILSDFVIADRAAAHTVARAVLAPSPDVLRATRVDTVKLGRLWAVLSTSAYDAEWVARIQPIAEGGEEGPWVFEVPSELVRALAALEAAAHAQAGARWAACEELRLDAFSEPETVALVRALAGLAQRSATLGKSLLLRLSL